VGFVPGVVDAEEDPRLRHTRDGRRIFNKSWISTNVDNPENRPRGVEGWLAAGGEPKHDARTEPNY
jgi:hypothetical protein